MFNFTTLYCVRYGKDFKCGSYLGLTVLITTEPKMTVRLCTHICTQALFHSRCPSSGKSLLSSPPYTVLEDTNSEQFLQCCGSLLALSYHHICQVVHTESLKHKFSYGRSPTKLSDLESV
jgi:hypothetical protein